MTVLLNWGHFLLFSDSRLVHLQLPIHALGLSGPPSIFSGNRVGSSRLCLLFVQLLNQRCRLEVSTNLRVGSVLDDTLFSSTSFFLDPETFDSSPVDLLSVPYPTKTEWDLDDLYVSTGWEGSITNCEYDRIFFDVFRDRVFLVHRESLRRYLDRIHGLTMYPNLGSYLTGRFDPDISLPYLFLYILSPPYVVVLDPLIKYLYNIPRSRSPTLTSTLFVFSITESTRRSTVY